MLYLFCLMGLTHGLLLPHLPHVVSNYAVLSEISPSMLLAQDMEAPREVFSVGSFAAAGKVGLATVLGVIPFVAFNKILAPKLGLIDESVDTEFKEGEEPWR